MEPGPGAVFGIWHSPQHGPVYGYWHRVPPAPASAPTPAPAPAPTATAPATQPPWAARPVAGPWLGHRAPAARVQADPELPAAEPASMWQRLLAFLIDITMASLLFTLCWRDVPWSMFDDMDIASDWSFEAMELRVVAQLDEMTMSFFFEDLLLYYITLFIYETLFVWLFSGTLGKLMCGTRVEAVPPQRRLSLGQAALRSFCKTCMWAIASFIFLGAFVRQGFVLHDQVARTRVVKRRARQPQDAHF